MVDLDRFLLPKNAEDRMAVPPIPRVINGYHRFVRPVPETARLPMSAFE
jgi:hypothetical protein